MRLFVAWWFLAVCSLAAVKANINDNLDFYTAGVVEYNPQGDKNASPGRYIDTNLRAYLNFIELAKKENVDVLVFPEATLNYLSTREAMIEHGIILPDPADKIAPWEHEGYSEVLKLLSKKCKDEQIYVLVNVVEKVPCGGSISSCRRRRRTHNDGYNVFNTNIVFDRQGRLISKYQKYNLFIEPLVDEPLTPEYATFTTDFGVKFGHFICFDILFKEPTMSLLKRENVTNILYSSMWFSELAFYTSTQTHQGWAYANNVNLISAGANKPSHGSTGSGIFIGRKQIANIIVSPEEKSKLLTAKVPKDIRLHDGHAIPEKREPFTPTEMQNLHISEYFANLDNVKVDIVNQTQTICVYEDICCTFNIKIKNNEIPPGKIAYKYKLTANYSKRLYGERKCGEFYCAILACTSDNPKSCARRFKDNRGLFNAVEFESVDITAKVRYDSEDDILSIPNTVDTSILPLEISNYRFSTIRTFDEAGLHYKEYRMESTRKLKNILTFGISGRNFAMDEVTLHTPTNLV